MWNLTGEDIQRAKDELRGRRAAIQARYEAELKQLESDIADIETFERFAVKFVSDFKADPPPAEPQPTADEVVAEIVAQVTADPQNAMPEAAPNSAATEAAAVAADQVPETAAVQKTSSRWRMRLNAGETSV
ncbi:MAG: hypothetical protein ACM3JG_11445 [Thiohalocapsa sp.]